jgi:hypothetical protein
MKAMLDRINSKAAKEKELAEAREIQGKIEAKQREDAEVQEKIKALVRKRKTLSDDVVALKIDEKYRTVHQVKRIKSELEEIEELKTVLENHKDPDANSCPICLDPPDKVFNCVKCHNWICQRCKLDKAMVSCPSCRQNFKARPPKRNETVERLLRDRN